MNFQPPTMSRVARFSGLRALTWAGGDLYASRGYTILRATLTHAVNIDWQTVAQLYPSLRRRLSVTNRLTARLFRDGFHALAVLPNGGLIGAVPGSIVTQVPGQTEFHETYAITRGTRPLHITAVPEGTIYWGEYFDNPDRDEVHIYASADAGETWTVAYTFPKGAIRLHNIVHDRARHILEEANAGIVIEPENSKELVAGIQRLQANRTLANAMGQNGRQYIVSNFSRAHSAEKYIQMLERLLKQS